LGRLMTTWIGAIDGPRDAVARANLNLAGPGARRAQLFGIMRARFRHASCCVAGMLTCPDRHSEKLQLLRFASSFLWADLEVANSERAFMLELASELEVDEDDALALLGRPPCADDVDPSRVSRSLAASVRTVALRAIAADGRVAPSEMQMFHLLDELLPR
jgi:hypothetical protein